MVDANGAASTEHWSRAASCWTPSATCREERDKAAPLGRNQPAVVDVAADGLLRERVLELVVALEVCSEHPLAARSSPPSVATRSPAVDVWAVLGAGVAGQFTSTIARRGRGAPAGC